MAYTNGARCTLGVPLKNGNTEKVSPGQPVKGDVHADHIVVKAWITNGVLLVGAPAGDSADVKAAAEAEAAENERRAKAAAVDAENAAKAQALLDAGQLADDVKPNEAPIEEDQTPTEADAETTAQADTADADAAKNPWEQ